MFVRLLVMLISDVLCCFSVLLCCRSFVLIVAQRGEIKESWNIGQCQCDRVHLVRSSALHLSPRGAIERMPSQLHNTRCPSRPYAPSLQHLRRRDFEVVTCDQTQTPTIECIRPWDRTQCLRLNACGITIDRTTCNRAHPWPDSTLNFVYK